MKSARCVHGAAWYRECPWCASEAASAMYEARHDGHVSGMNLCSFTFWRYMTPADTLALIEREATLEGFRNLSRRALDALWE